MNDHTQLTCEDADADALVHAVLGACAPDATVQRAISGSALQKLSDKQSSLQRIGLIAMGKAALGMAVAAEEKLGGVGGLGGVVGQIVAGVVVVPSLLEDEARQRLHTCQVFAGDHPLPTQRSIAAGQAVQDFAKTSGKKNSESIDRLLVLISGGASAMVTLPVQGVSLESVRTITQALLRKGACINEINTIRQHIDQLKGGKLAKLVRPLPTHVLAISDVIGDLLEMVGSGPCSRCRSTALDALELLKHHDLLSMVPEVTQFLQESARDEQNNAALNGEDQFDHISSQVIGSNATAIEAACDWLEAHGWHVVQKLTDVTGDADSLGQWLAEKAHELCNQHEQRVAVVAGSETTVLVGDAVGTGGPCQEVALRALIDIQGLKRVRIMTFSTDGVDGPTRAAGAMVTGQSAAKGRAMGLDSASALTAHDSYGYLHAIGASIITGPTGTNVNDVAVVMVSSVQEMV